MDNNNNSNSNNNNSNNDFEPLFWKVFRNKYLFNNIINQIPLLSIECSDLTKYYVGNRLKFKNIQNLEWFFEKEVKESSLNLLKLKIQHKEELQVNNEGICALIRECQDEQIFEYIFENYKNKFIQVNTISNCASAKNKFAFDFFLNKIQQDPSLLKLVLPIHQSTIESVLQTSDLYFIEKVLKTAPVIDDSIKNFIFKLVSTNKNSKEIIPFLISNPQYYNL